jgi:flagellar hook-length control protein FliK
MTIVSVLPAAPAPVKGTGSRTTTPAATEDFAAMLAGLVSGVAPVDVAPAAVPQAGVTPTAAALPAPVVPPGAAALPEGAGESGDPAALPATPTTPAPVAAASPAASTTATATPAAPAPAVPADAAPLAAAPAEATAPVATASPTTTPSTDAPVTVISTAPATPATPTTPTTPTTPAQPAAAPAGLADAPQGPAGVEVDAVAADQAPGTGEDDSAAAEDEHTHVLSAAPAPQAETSRTAGPVPAESLAVAPTTEARPVSAPAAPAPAPAPPPAAPPATQVVTQLAPVLEGPDGSYTLSLQLYPEELGAVQVEVSMRGGEISLALHAADEVSKEVLRAALPQLREQLEATGLTATDVSVDSGKPDDSREQPTTPRRSNGLGTADGDDTAAPAPAPDPDAALDLRM